jgi:hypothetical protein
MLQIQNFEVLSEKLRTRLRHRILRFCPTNYKYAHSTEFLGFIRHISNDLKMQNFEVLSDKLLTCSRGQNFEVLCKKSRTSSRHRILRFYPTN